MRYSVFSKFKILFCFIQADADSLHLFLLLFWELCINPLKVSGNYRYQLL
jgi:hypothetical protein